MTYEISVSENLFCIGGALHKVVQENEKQKAFQVVLSRETAIELYTLIEQAAFLEMVREKKKEGKL